MHGPQVYTINNVGVGIGPVSELIIALERHSILHTTHINIRTFLLALDTD